MGSHPFKRCGYCTVLKKEFYLSCAPNVFEAQRFGELRCSSLSHPGKLQSVPHKPLFLQGFSLFSGRKTEDFRRVKPVVGSLFLLAL